MLITAYFSTMSAFVQQCQVLYVLISLVFHNLEVELFNTDIATSLNNHISKK